MGQKKSKRERPALLVAAEDGNVFEHPTLEMALETGVDPMGSAAVAPAAVAPAASLEHAPRERARAEWRATSQLRDTAPDWWDVPQPVCEAAARAPAWLRPTLVTTIGLPASSARSARASSPAPSLKPSM